MYKNLPVTGFPFVLINAASGAAVTSGTVSGFVTIDGGVQTALTNTPVHEGGGQWSVNLTADETNGTLIGLLFTHADAIPASFTIDTTPTYLEGTGGAPAVAGSSYLTIRNKFVELSGRYDLINNDQTDNGADFFLNAGQKYLDRMMSSGKAMARYPLQLTAGVYVAYCAGLRAVKEVWIADVDGKTQLEPVSMNWLRNEYSESFATVPYGVPKYYAPAVFRPFPDTATGGDLTGMYDTGDLLVDGTHFQMNGIVIMPPPETPYTLSIFGLFYSPTLYATLAAGVWTQSASYWTEVHPDTLIAAALFKLEGFYRNSEGAKDFKATVMDDVTGLDHDLVEEELAGSLQMGG